MKKLSKIRFELLTDDIKDHRYVSIDDWWDPREWTGELRFKTVVADMGNMDYNFLVLIHALVEQYLCYKHKISDEQVTRYDTNEGKDSDNPGEDIQAPYHKEHMTANEVESLLSVALGVDWIKYENAISKTLKKWKKK